MRLRPAGPAGPVLSMPRVKEVLSLMTEKKMRTAKVLTGSLILLIGILILWAL